jgi:hypothetical protein
MRLFHKPGFLEFPHDIPDRRRTPARTIGKAIREHKRTYRIAGDEVLLDHRGQHGLRASVETILFRGLEG